jgi:hypothetical protein
MHILICKSPVRHLTQHAARQIAPNFPQIYIDRGSVAAACKWKWKPDFDRTIEGMFSVTTYHVGSFCDDYDVVNTKTFSNIYPIKGKI